MKRAATMVILGLLAALWTVWGSPARAATATVTLTDQGPSPATVTIKAGDSVRFVNNGSSTHTVTSNEGWTYSKQIPAGGNATTPAFPKAGTYSYDDTWTLIAVPQQAAGSIDVKKVAAPPSPKPSKTATRSPSPAATPSASPSLSPVPTASANAPGLGGVTLPTPTPQPSSSVPAPEVASPQPSATLLAEPAYGGKDGLVQSSPHRFGLPAALAVVAIVGTVSLLLRYLLSLPEARVARW